MRSEVAIGQRVSGNLQPWVRYVTLQGSAAALLQLTERPRGKRHRNSLEETRHSVRQSNAHAIHNDNTAVLLTVSFAAVYGCIGNKETPGKILLAKPRVHVHASAENQ